jgi:hypothetical protein
MKEFQKKATENRLKILSQHSDVIKWCQNKLKQQTIVKASLKELTAAGLTANCSSSSLIKMENNLAATESTHLENVSAIGNTEEASQLNESNLMDQSIIELKIMKQVKKNLTSEK